MSAAHRRKSHALAVKLKMIRYAVDRRFFSLRRFASRVLRLAPQPLGVNLIGFFETPNSVGEAGRPADLAVRVSLAQ
jgi:hypothetical protein